MKKEENPVDDIFRESLGDYRVTPSEESRETLLREAGEIMKKTPPGRKTIFFISLSLVLLLATIGGTGIYFMSRTKSSPPPAEVRQNLNASSAHAVRPGIKQNAPVVQDVPVQNRVTVHPSKDLAASPGPAIKNASPLADHSSTTSHAGTTGSGMPVTVNTAQTTEKADTLKTNTAMQTEPEPESMLPVIPADTLTAIGDTGIILPGKDHVKSSSQRNMHFSAGIQYTPEMMFNLVNDEQKFVNNFGLEGAFYFERFSVRTGIGLSITKGSTETAIGYEKYLGSINKLDSMTFSWNSQTYTYIPRFYTTLTNVYDTAVKYTYTSIEKRYTYLQVPLILGYDFLAKEKVRLGIRIGPVASFLLNEKQLTTGYDPGQDRIIRSNNVTPDRIQVNWQIVGGVDVSVILTRKLTLELEPEVRYYFNSVYEKSDITKKPWSAGIRVALHFNFVK